MSMSKRNLEYFSTNGTGVDLSFLVLFCNNFSLSIFSTFWSWEID